ncbi:unnamed protein product [Staurois parvus]|uniref:Uncharacterized protein n=1 Tax=Staurois parvus TaxID=386267 RepID=A0ABN9BII8_9NEOB|nr:unnamed protein product [Staurois parvus]
MGPLCPCPNSKKPMKKVPGASHGPPTDPGPSVSARVSKCRGGLTTHGAPGNRGSWGPCILAQTQKNL